MTTNKTKDQLEQELKDAKAQLAEATKTIETQTAQIYDLKAQEEGWLITAPNEMFDGETSGIHFKNGQAFIPRMRECPQFALPPYKEDTIEQMEKDKDDPTKTRTKREAYDVYMERQTTPTSALAVEALTKDFGYEAEFFGLDELGEISKRVDARVLERAKAEEALEKRMEAENLMTPHVMQGAR